MASKVQNGEELARLVSRIADDAEAYFGDVDSYEDAAARAIANAEYLDLTDRQTCDHINRYGPEKGQRYHEFKRLLQEHDDVDGVRLSAWWRLRVLATEELLDRHGDG